MNKKRAAALGVAGVLVAAGVTIGVIASQPASCSSDPAGQIAKLKAGQTFHGTGCYDTAGILIATSGVTIDGGTFDDTATTAPLKPVIKIETATDVTVENVALTGTNTTGTYHGKLVGQSGIDVRSSTDVNLSNVTTDDTFGDGLTIYKKAGDGISSDVTVDGYTITDAGRQGVTPILNSGKFTNVDVVSAADSAVDIESDSKGVGPSNLTFTNLTAPGGINVVSPVGGYLTFLNTSLIGRFTQKAPATTAYQGSFTCERRAPGACVTVTAGTLAIDPSTTFARLPGKPAPTEPYTLAVPPGVITGAPIPNV